MNKTLDQIYTANPVTTIEDSDLFYSVRSAADGAITGASLKLASAITGEVRMYAGSAAPTGWLLSYGQAISRTTYAALFTAIGTTYGVGDGGTTFNVPDMRGRVVAGKDDMGGTSANRLTNAVTGGVDGDALGGTGGTESYLLTAVSNLTGGGADTAANQETLNNVQPTIILNFIIKT